MYETAHKNLYVGNLSTINKSVIQKNNSQKVDPEMFAKSGPSCNNLFCIN